MLALELEGAQITGRATISMSFQLVTLLKALAVTAYSETCNVRGNNFVYLGSLDFSLRSVLYKTLLSHARHCLCLCRSVRAWYSLGCGH